MSRLIGNRLNTHLGATNARKGDTNPARGGDASDASVPGAAPSREVTLGAAELPDAVREPPY